MQFVVLSNVTAADYVDWVTMPIFKDPTPMRDAWTAFDPAAAKHDTAIFNAAGQAVLFRRVADAGFFSWRDDVATVIRSLPR